MLSSLTKRDPRGRHEHGRRARRRLVRALIAPAVLAWLLSGALVVETAGPALATTSDSDSFAEYISDDGLQLSMSTFMYRSEVNGKCEAYVDDIYGLQVVDPSRGWTSSEMTTVLNRIDYSLSQTNFNGIPDLNLYPNSNAVDDYYYHSVPSSGCPDWLENGYDQRNLAIGSSAREISATVIGIVAGVGTTAMITFALSALGGPGVGLSVAAQAFAGCIGGAVGGSVNTAIRNGTQIQIAKSALAGCAYGAVAGSVLTKLGTYISNNGARMFSCLNSSHAQLMNDSRVQELVAAVTAAALGS